MENHLGKIGQLASWLKEGRYEESVCWKFETKGTIFHFREYELPSCT